MGIELKNVSFQYGEKNVLSNINLNICSGEMVGILGKSGCGKSTLLKLIAGLYTPTSGEIVIDGETEKTQRIEKVAMVMQSPMLLPVTIKENITCGHEMNDEWIRSVCDASQLTEWITTLELGLDTYLGERTNELSGGQAQRIAIARAMAKNANIILLDEPTSALDHTTSVAVMRAIKELTRRKTVIHVTHQKEMLNGYQRILYMEGGKIHE